MAQRLYFARASGVARFAYNWALAEWQRQYKAGEKPNDTALRRQLNAIKRAQFPWMYDVAKCVVQEAIIDLGTAYRAFFERRSEKPRFKNKGDRRSFCAANEVGKFCTDGKRIKLPMLGWVRMREAVRFSGPLKRATVSCEGGRWFVAVMVDISIPMHIPPQEVVGIDVGSRSFAALSTGEIIPGPKPHKAALARLRHLNKTQARRRLGSKNFRKAKTRLAKLHARIAHIRCDAQHKLTTRLTKTYRVIGIEDLNVRGMVKDRHVARGVLDTGFFELRRQLTYKAQLYGSRVFVANRWFPSSKTCSCCGVVDSTLARGAETFRCAHCGFEVDRDVNAAVNLARLAASSAVTACGAASSGPTRKRRVKLATTKQEENTALLEAA
jgi:putative transposase